MSQSRAPRLESADARSDIDVAIVGAGPVGLALAALLDRQGLTSMVFERRATLHRDPQAHVVNTRTMEILRELGLGSAVQAAASPPMLMRSITWCESLAGLELGRIRLQGEDAGDVPARLALSPATMANLAQNRLEPMLLDVVRRAPRSEVFFEREVVAAEETGNGVTVRVRGGAREETRTASYVVACDGAGSAVRRSLGIEMIGPASLQKFVSVYFEADLRRWIGDRPGPLFWIAGARTRGAVIGFDLDRTWALMVPYADPHTAEDFTDEVVRRLVADAIGDPDASFRVTSVGNWNMSAQIAERYRAGRLFLAGDAAHRFPPTGGLGMNTGIQDAHNLAWKLAAVLRGDADPALLDTYEPERRTVAQTNCDQSVRNAMRMIEVDMVLGAPTLQAVDPGPIARDERPSIDFGMEGDGDAAVAKRRAVQEVIQSQAEHFDFTGLDLGFFYESGAVIADGSQAPTVDVRHYRPTTRPGSRLPHAWVTRLGTRVSTLDAASPGRFTVLTGSAGQAWVDAARSIVRDSGLELGAVRIVGVGDAAQPGDLVDADGGWAAVRGTGDAGALLVRPDGHVACRWPGAAADREDAARRLGDALERLLGSAFRSGLAKNPA